MIDEKTIENIVDSNVSLVCELIPDSPIVDYQDSLKNLMICCIKIGIELALKDLWHPVSEEPKMLKPVVVEYKDGMNLCYDYHELLTTFKDKEETWQEYMDDWYGKGNTTRWFYINDVVPKQKGDE